MKCFLLKQAIISGWSSFALGSLIPKRFARWWSHTDSDTNRFECIPTSGTANRLYEFDANGVEYREDAAVGYEQYLLIFENKDIIYDICDAVRCTKALYLAAQNDFNKASLETLNAAAEILGVKYDRVKRK